MNVHLSAEDRAHMDYMRRFFEATLAGLDNRASKGEEYPFFGIEVRDEHGNIRQLCVIRKDDTIDLAEEGKESEE